MNVIALSDLHGQLPIFTRLDAVQRRYPDALTVFMGDYIDCFSANNPGFAVLERVRKQVLADPNHTVALMGNHEAGMLEFMTDPNQNAWLDYGGLGTLAAIATQLGLPPAGASRLAQERQALAVRERVLAEQADLLDWVAALPFRYDVGRLTFVHAGFNQRHAALLTATSRRELLWVRDQYWYDPAHDGVFAHGFDRTVVTGHTPNGAIAGRYEGQVRPAKAKSDRHPVYAIQYPGEFPRYLLDGGAGSTPAGDLLGNIGVFASETGLLIDVVED